MEMQTLFNSCDTLEKLICPIDSTYLAKIFRGLGCKIGSLGCQRIHGHVSKSQHAKNKSLIVTSTYYKKSSNKTLFLNFKEKYKTCIHPLNLSLRFSAEQFLYKGEEVIDNLSLNSSITWDKES
jgi:hypothetical protein